MSNSRQFSSRVLVVGPGSHCKGGIAAVINNYARTGYWTECGCTHFSSAGEGSALHKSVYALYRYLVFLLTILVFKPAMISLHTASGISFYRKFLYLLSARALRIPVVLHIHPAQFIHFYNRGSALLQWLIRLAGNSSSRIVFLSENQKRDFLAVFPADKMVVISNPVDMQAFSVWRDDWRTAPRQILFMGWIVREKGVYDLVEAMPHILREFPDALFVFAGPKSTDHLRSLLAERGLERSASVLGWVEGEDRLRLLRTSRLLILPSYTEGVPNVILEAMASGLPVITTPVGGIPSVVQDGVSCIFIQPRDVAGIASAICRLLRDERECQRLANHAWQEASQKYDLEVVARQLCALYRAIRSGKEQSVSRLETGVDGEG